MAIGPKELSAQMGRDTGGGTGGGPGVDFPVGPGQMGGDTGGGPGVGFAVGPGQMEGDTGGGPGGGPGVGFAVGPGQMGGDTGGGPGGGPGVGFAVGPGQMGGDTGGGPDQMGGDTGGGPGEGFSAGQMGGGSLSNGLEESQTRYGKVICYSRLDAVHPGNLQGGTTFADALPIFMIQLFVANACYRAFYYLTRPLRLPPMVPQILCGLLFCPTLLGQHPHVLEYIFPPRFSMVLETFANLALVYNIFLLGLGIDLKMIKIKDFKPVIIAIVCLLASLAVGTGLYYFPGNGMGDKILAGGFYWSVALACTNFPDLARILADLKLLRTDMGRTAMCAAVISDLCTWVLLVLLFAVFTKGGRYGATMPYAIISTVAFVILCIYVIRPGIAWAFKKTVKGGHVEDTHVWFTLVGVIVCALITDASGVTSITGAFLFGLSIPQDHIIRNIVEEKLHYFLSGILMPLFFIICGMRANLASMYKYTSLGTLAFSISSAFMVKIVSTLVCSILLRMPLRDGFAIGALMNTKGTLALVVLTAGRDSKSLDVIMYTHMTLTFLVMSMIVQPLLLFTYQKKKSGFYKNRTIQKHKGETELRVLACVHVLPNVSGITNLLQVSNPTKISPLSVYAIHLVELTGRTTASLLIMNDEAKPKANFSDRVRAESEQIAEGFEAMEVNNSAMMVQTITAVSPYVTMHEDIATLAEDKRVSFILLPYHKSLTSDGRLDEGNDAYAEINQKVLSHAPCSVGILVDRGMTVIRSASSSLQNEPTRREVAMLFTGGPDDREALAYAWRMVGEQQETVKLTVMRFVPSREALVSAGRREFQKENQTDEEFIYEFNFKTMDDPWVTYTEKVVNDGSETIAAIREMEDNNSYDLYIVGRSYKGDTPVTSGLTDWTSTTPDLGTIGDTLASSNFTMQASVLVIQQYSSAKRGTADNNQEHVGGGVKTAQDDDDEEEEQYHIGMRK